MIVEFRYDTLGIYVRLNSKLEVELEFECYSRIPDFKEFVLDRHHYNYSNFKYLKHGLFEGCHAKFTCEDFVKRLYNDPMIIGLEKE